MVILEAYSFLEPWLLLLTIVSVLLTLGVYDWRAILLALILVIGVSALRIYRFKTGDYEAWSGW